MFKNIYELVVQSSDNLMILNGAAGEVEKKANEINSFVDMVFWVISFVVWGIILLLLVIPVKQVREFAKEHILYLVGAGILFPLIATIIGFFQGL